MLCLPLSASCDTKARTLLHRIPAVGQNKAFSLKLANDYKDKGFAAHVKHFKNFFLAFSVSGKGNK